MSDTAHAVWLSVGDGITDDYLPLKVREPGIAWPTPDDAATERELQVPISIYGDDANMLMANRRAIETKLRQARRARGPHGISAIVTLGVQLAGAASPIFFDIKRGGLKIDMLAIASGWMQATLFLTCEADARGVDIPVANLLTYTDDASNAAWVKTSATVTADNLAGPDGSLTADTLAPGASNSSMYQVATGLTASTDYAFSVWLKATSAAFSTEVALYTSGGSLIASRRVTIGSVWQRYFVNADIGVNTSVRCQLGGNSSWATGEDVAFWGAQLEPGTEPSEVYLRVAAASAPLNGDQGWYLYGIPGDVPATMQLTVADQSTGSKAINSLVIGARSGDDLCIGDYVPVVPFAVGADGTHGADSDAYGAASNSRTLAAGGGTSWRELGYAAMADKPYNRGRFQVLARLTDTVTAQPAPSALSGTVTPGSDVATQVPTPGRSGHNITTGGTSLAVSLGGSSTAGSTLIAFVYCNGSNSQHTSVSGWTSEGIKTFTAADAGTNSIQLLKRENAPATSSVTFPLNATAGSVTTRIDVIEIKNVVASNVIGQIDYDLQLNDPGAAWEATTSPGQLAFGIWGAEDNSASADQWSNEFTEGGDSNGTVWAYKLIEDKSTSPATKGIGDTSDLWAGWRLTFIADTDSGTENAGTLTPMTLTAKVVAVDYSGTVSAPSAASTPVVVAVANSKVVWGWTAPVSGGTSHYLLVATDGTTFYEFLSDTTSYELTDLADGVVVTGYPTAAGTSFASWRGAASTTAQTERYGGLVTRNTVSGQPELVTLGAFDLPPTQRLDDGTQPVGALFLQEAWAGASQNVTAADVAWFFPTGNTASLVYTPTPRTSLYRWIYESRRDGTSAGAIQTTGGADAGTPNVRGRVVVGPVAAHIVIAATEGNNNPNMVDLQFGIESLIIRPRYRDLIGAVS